jgi:hypothetical protein
MDFNDILKADRDGTLTDYSLSDLKEMRKICAVHLQNRSAFMVDPCKSVERAILQKEREESEKRDASRQRDLLDIKQTREAEHTLWRYWSLADWSERFGMLMVFGMLLLIGFGASQIPFLTTLLTLIKSLIP